jgi:hypothetical protein
MKLEDISKGLAGYGTYGRNILLNDYRNARQRLGGLDKLYDGVVKDNNYNLVSAGLKGQASTALAGMGTAGLSAATGIAGNAMQAAQIGDTSAYENALADYADFGNYNYVNYDQLANDMSQNYLAPMPTYEDIRGMSNGEKAGNIVSSTLQGATAGLQIGGPIGAAVGGVAGLLGSGIGVIAGNRKAQRKQDALEAQATIAQATSNMNFQAAHERIGDYQNRKGVVNAAEKGGQMDRKQSITEFANRKLGKPKYNEQHFPSITRTTVDGGVRVRIRK